jgi:hypothetical protein
MPLFAPLVASRVRHTRTLLALALTIVSVAAACGDGAPKANGPIARFATGAALAFDAAPFPGDFRRVDGVLSLGAVPSSKSDAFVFDRLRALLASRDGFCATCNVYFPVEGALDAGSIPSLTEGSATDAVVLIDAEPSSPEYGRFIPLEIEWSEIRSTLALRPVPGIALRPKHRYAAAVTTALRGPGGEALRRSPAFQTSSAPLVADLVAAGLAEPQIAVATVFTTEDVLAELRDARAEIERGDPPTVVVDEVWHAGEALDTLMGIPSETRAGIDVPPASGEGTRSIRHDGIALVVGGRLVAPRLLTGAGVAVGELVRDESGALTRTSTHEVPFVLSIPEGADLSSLRVVVHQHGFNASRVTGFVLMETLARTGVAVFSIDAYQHGERAASARDELHALRGDDVLGADGLAETDLLDVSGRVFGLQGVPADEQLYPGFPLSAFVQFVADVCSSVRFVSEGDLGPLQDADPSLASLAFGQGIGYAGNSMGAVVGTGVMSVEPRIARAALNVPPGSIIETLAISPAFRPLVSFVFLSLLGVDGSQFDEVERRMIMHPVIDLYRWALEPVDPLALSRFLELERETEGAPEILFQPAELDEVAWTGATESFLEAAQASLVSEYAAASHGMLEVEDAESVWEPPYVPPLVPRAVPLPLVNPIDAVHDELTGFFEAL